MKKIILLVLGMLTLSGCVSQNKVDDITYEETSEITNFVKMEFEDYGSIIIELYPEIAPLTVENFQKLVDLDFYDGLTIHRVVEEFVIQGGDPNGDGSGGSENTIVGEFYRNDGIEREISHTKGILSMARSADMNSASSQFFICLENATNLDDLYAAFGEVIAGIDVVDDIASLDVVEGSETPVEAPVIKEVYFVNIK